MGQGIITVLPTIESYVLAHQSAELSALQLAPGPTPLCGHGHGLVTFLIKYDWL